MSWGVSFGDLLYVLMGAVKGFIMGVMLLFADPLFFYLLGVLF